MCSVSNCSCPGRFQIITKATWTQYVCMVKKKRKKKTLDRSRTPARWAHRYACLQCACKASSLHDDARESLSKVEESNSRYVLSSVPAAKCMAAAGSHSPDQTNRERRWNKGTQKHSVSKVNASLNLFFFCWDHHPWTKSFFVRVTTNYTLSRRPFSLPIIE